MAYQVGQSDQRPWGTWLVLDAGPQFAVKRITVAPGQILSLQYHNGRDEHWTVVAGGIVATVGEGERELAVNESAFVPRGTVHRMANRGSVPAVVIEVQCGADLREDDIVRLEDVYGRAGTAPTAAALADDAAV